jgi:hypothetical protein
MVPAAALLRWRMGATFSAARVFPSSRAANTSVPAVPKLVLQQHGALNGSAADNDLHARTKGDRPPLALRQYPGHALPR